MQQLQINQQDISHQQNKKKSHIIFSIDAEKPLDKIQHLFMIKKTSQQSEYRENI